MNVNTAKIIQKQGNRNMTSHIRTKIRLRQISDIYCELIKIREEETLFTCDIRNMLQIFSGEMKLHCSIDLDKEIEMIAGLLDEGISISNWEKTNNIVLKLYETVLRKCSVLNE
jgi:hypothetical protein